MLVSKLRDRFARRLRQADQAKAIILVRDGLGEIR